METPDPRGRYRTFWRRFWAGFIDGLVLWPLAWMESLIKPEEQGALLFILWSTFSYSFYWLYSVSLHARYGKTFGKMVTGVVVLDISESRILTPWQAFMRDIGYIVLNTLALLYLIYLVASGRYESGAEYTSATGMLLTWIGLGWVALEFVTMLTNAKRRAIHDFIAGTVVVKDA